MKVAILFRKWLKTRIIFLWQCRSGMPRNVIEWLYDTTQRAAL
jgi:hypothetical protein